MNTKIVGILLLILMVISSIGTVAATNLTSGDTYVSNESNGKVVGHNGSGVASELPGVWDDYFTNSASEEDKEKYLKLKDMNATWIWDENNTYVYGASGSVFKTNIEINSDNNYENISFIFAADNAATIYVNGKLAGYTTESLKEALRIEGDYLGVDLDNNLIKGDRDGWGHVYDITINLSKGINEIIIIAVNSVGTENTGTPNDNYNDVNNPCGLIFGFKIPVENNVTNGTEEPKGPVVVVANETNNTNSAEEPETNGTNDTNTNNTPVKKPESNPVIDENSTYNEDTKTTDNVDPMEEVVNGVSMKNTGIPLIVLIICLIGALFIRKKN
ncbi:MAG: hypothetical protein ACRCVG_03455 [Methanobacteriaceae archaeon]